MHMWGAGVSVRSLFLLFPNSFFETGNSLHKYLYIHILCVTEVIGICESSDGVFWTLNSGPLQKNCVLLTIYPLLQHRFAHLSSIEISYLKHNFSKTNNFEVNVG